jgi:hypothetical protein
MVEEFFPASRKRVLLAIYLDYVFFSALLTLFLYLSTGHVELPSWQEFGSFAVLEALLYSVSGSPGQYFLSMNKSKVTISVPGAPPENKELLSIEPRIARHESWLTMILGVLFVLEGSKQLVRWTMWTPPLPLFGLSFDPATFAACRSSLGQRQYSLATRF